MYINHTGIIMIGWTCLSIASLFKNKIIFIYDESVTGPIDYYKNFLKNLSTNQKFDVEKFEIIQDEDRLPGNIIKNKENIFHSIYLFASKLPSK